MGEKKKRRAMPIIAAFDHKLARRRPPSPAMMWAVHAHGPVDSCLHESGISASARQHEQDLTTRLTVDQRPVSLEGLTQ